MAVGTEKEKMTGQSLTVREQGIDRVLEEEQILSKWGA